MKQRLLLILAALALTGIVAWWADVPGRFGWGQADDNVLTLQGNIDIRQVELGFRVAGRIQSMQLEEGEQVRAGAVLAQLDARSYEDRVKEAAAQVEGQAATLEKLKAGPRATEIAQARAALAEREAEFHNAWQFFERMQILRTSGAVAQSEFDAAQAARSMSAARVASAKQALRQLEEGSRAEDIAAARANLQAARASLAAAETALADTRLVAPSDGIVLSRVREAGAIVSPSDIAYVISLVQPIWVRAYVAEPHLGRVFPGMEVTVIPDGSAGRTYRGRIGFISPVAEFTPKSVETPELRDSLVYRLRIIIDQGDQGLRQGMPVTVRVALHDASTAR